jgi:MoxR-like ATPase
MTDVTEAPATLDAARFAELTGAIVQAVGSVIDGKPDAVRAALVTLLAEGHLLIEDVPGVGKTMLARALSAAIDARVRRIQFTPDLLPSDVTGVSVFNPATRDFEFTPGAIFADVVIADEINRSSPKTQSALLEAMAEGQVTVDGRTHLLPSPFFVVATQNPLDMEGTYALPEAQRDRFMMRISMGYPDAAAEAEMLRQRDTANPIDLVTPVVGLAELDELIRWARRVHVSPAVEEYARCGDALSPRAPARGLAARDARSRPGREGVGSAGYPHIRHPGRRRDAHLPRVRAPAHPDTGLRRCRRRPGADSDRRDRADRARAARRAGLTTSPCDPGP